MIIKCAMFIEDIEDIYKNMSTFKEAFPFFEILSKTIIPMKEDDEGDTEEDLFEVTFDIPSMNNFWFMGKTIGLEQYHKRIKA